MLSLRLARRSSRSCGRRCARARSGWREVEAADGAVLSTWRRSSTCAWSPTSTASASERDRGRPDALAARPRSTRSTSRSTGARGRSRARPRRVRWVRRYSQPGRARRGVARARGAAGALLDRRPARALAARDRRRRRRLPDLDLDQARDRPQAAARGGPAAPDGDADRPLLPVLALDVVVRRGARLRPLLPAAAAVRGGGRDGVLAPLPRRALPVRHRRRRRARHACLGALGDDEGRDRRAAQRGQVVAVQRAHRAPGAEAANYPFTTIEPNVAVVPVARRAARRGRAQTIGASNIVPDTIEFHDIAGLVEGRARGRGPGQQVPGQHPRDRRAAARGPLPPRRQRHPPGRRVDPARTSRRSRPS